MDWLDLFWFSLGVLLFAGAKGAGRGNWNEDYTSLKQTKMLQGIMVLGVALHHMAQKTCGPWHPQSVIEHGLDVFLPVGHMVVGVFLFCSGLGLYKSLRTKPDYLKGFFRKRILPVIIAFYLSEIIYTAVRLLMGEPMDALTVLWYLSGLHMANFNAWYVIVIPFFYLAFWASFRFVKRERVSVLLVFLFTLGYTLLGACVDHQNDWWMRGEWWYNSILLFPLGIVFARHEEKITRTLKKGYWFWLLLFFIGFFLLHLQSEWLINHRLGYYGDWGDPLKVPKRLLSAGTQWAVALFFTMFWFTLMLKVRIGNRALAWLGAVTLDFYLMHGIFVELFGYSFLDISASLVHIRDVPLYVAAVLGCSVPATLLFRQIRLWLTGAVCGNRKQGDAPGNEEGPQESEALRRARKKAAGPGRARKLLFVWFWPAVCVMMILGGLLLFRQTPERVHGNTVISPPDGFAVASSDSRQTVWKYTGDDRKVNALVLDTTIRGDNGQLFGSAEEVLASCAWMTDAELYVNPQGIRMARGFSTEGTEYPMRRYYVETDDNVVLLSIIENDRYYDPAACEEAILQAADRIRKK